MDAGTRGRNHLMRQLQHRFRATVERRQQSAGSPEGELITTRYVIGGYCDPYALGEAAILDATR